MQNMVKTDIAIIGGGIAGLWLLNRLRALGYSVVLLESGALGGGQTHKAQGIIHGGMKYALQGNVTTATQAIADMPTVWRECLNGTGEINLNDVPVLSPRQYLWSPNTLGGKLSGFFANLTLKSQVKSLNKADFPDIFQHPDFNGQVYELDEMVLDMHALIRALSKPYQELIFKISAMQPEHFHFNEQGQLSELEIHAEPLAPISIKAHQYIFTAGAGNEFLSSLLKKKEIAMQRRPLHMVMMKTKFLYPLYAHCLGLSTTPRMTITTHESHDGQTIWYLGGQLAEEGVARDQTAQIEFAKKELATLFPWVDFSAAQWASFFVDRAEDQQPGNKRPDSCFTKTIANMQIAWPTKLAFAPKLTQEIISAIQKAETPKSVANLHALRGWPMPLVAKPMWDQLL